jgi:hypothetical protein
METESDVEIGLRDAELESLLLRVGERFGRVEPRQHMRDYVRGLLGVRPEYERNLPWPCSRPGREVGAGRLDRDR